MKAKEELKKRLELNVRCFRIANILLAPPEKEFTAKEWDILVYKAVEEFRDALTAWLEGKGKK